MSTEGVVLTFVDDITVNASAGTVLFNGTHRVISDSTSENADFNSLPQKEFTIVLHDQSFARWAQKNLPDYTFMPSTGAYGGASAALSMAEKDARKADVR